MRLSALKKKLLNSVNEETGKMEAKLASSAVAGHLLPVYKTGQNLLV
jgi:hypothetical protein